jgi:hypothetical protein
MKLTPQVFYKVSHSSLDEDVAHLSVFDDFYLATRYCKQLKLKSYKILRCELQHNNNEIQFNRTIVVRKKASRFYC